MLITLLQNQFVCINNRINDEYCLKTKKNCLSVLCKATVGVKLPTDLAHRAIYQIEFLPSTTFIAQDDSKGKLREE